MGKYKVYLDQFRVAEMLDDQGVLVVDDLEVTAFNLRMVLEIGEIVSLRAPGHLGPAGRGWCGARRRFHEQFCISRAQAASPNQNVIG